MKNLSILLCVIVASGVISGSIFYMHKTEEIYQSEEEAELNYTFGAKFEPPEGRILHGMGQFASGNEDYLDLLSEALYPASSLLFFTIADCERPWSYVKQTIQSYLDTESAVGRIPNLSISFVCASDKPTSPPETNPYFGMDEEVAYTTKHDLKIKELAQIVRSYKKPIFVRIGGEFSGWWNGYMPFTYPIAFRKVVEIFRAEGAENAAFIWCYEPDSPNDFDELSKLTGVYKWYPGDDVVDWFGIDVFAVSHFSGPLEDRGEITAKGKSERFLRMALEHKKPVMIVESSAVFVDITHEWEDGIQDWNKWFVPYFEFIKKHPQIKAFHYINCNWQDIEHYRILGWKQASININPYISQKYIEEISKPKYLHVGEVNLLKDYEKYK